MNLRSTLTTRLTTTLLTTSLLATTLLTTGCTTYRVPTAPAETRLVLNRRDVQIVDETRGSDWAFGIFPLSLLAPANFRARSYAIDEATRIAYRESGADFLLEPKVRTSYYNFLLFDYSTAEAAGKGVRVQSQ